MTSELIQIGVKTPKTIKCQARLILSETRVINEADIKRMLTEQFVQEFEEQELVKLTSYYNKCKMQYEYSASMYIVEDKQSQAIIPLYGTKLNNTIFTEEEVQHALMMTYPERLV